MNTEFGLANVWAQGDLVTRSVAVLLLLMSLASWLVIFIKTLDLLRIYGADYKCIFVGDAAMSPYEITHAGGASEFWNNEAGAVWLSRARDQWPHHVWINPAPENSWAYTQSTQIIAQIFAGRMVPMTLDGLSRAIKTLR